MDALVDVRGLTKHYAAPRSLAELVGGRRPLVRAVEDVTFALQPGETAGLLGESGCGKTTTGRLLLKLIEPTEGTIRLGGQDLAGLGGDGLRRFRRSAQLVFQNPFDALNPRLTIGRSLAEPLINTGVPRAEHADRIAKVLAEVRMPPTLSVLERYPHELSGGQLQRIVLARALVPGPAFIVADEPVSMLDVSVRAGILNLMRDLQARMGLTAVYISHDLALVRYVARRTLVMYLGGIVEDGPTEEVIRQPLHPYTKALVAAVPLPHVAQSRAPLPILPGVPDARSAAPGCRFAPRCPVAIPVCREVRPPLAAIGDGRRVACHLVTPAAVH